MKKTDFLKDVMHEIDMLKKYGTAEELAKLDLKSFSSQSSMNCIYGQMTGGCDSKRAKVLMDKSCIRVMDLSNKFGGAAGLEGKTFTNIKSAINGVNEGQGWKDEGGDSKYISSSSRNYLHLSALEAYICLKNANTRGIIKYLRWESKTVKL